MDILGKLKNQVEQVEVVNLQSESTTVGYENNRLKSGQTEETKGTAVRVVKDGRLGFSASTDERAGEKLIRNVLESAAYGDEVPISFPGKKVMKKVKIFDKKIADLSFPKMVEMGQALVDTLLEVDSELQVNAKIVREKRVFSYQNHIGFEETYQGSPLLIELDVYRVKGDDILIIWDLIGSTHWEDDYLAPARKAGEKLKLAEKSGVIKSGRMPVLFSPKGALALTFPIVAGLNGKEVYKGVSPNKDKVGEKLFDEKITVVDDPTLVGEYRSVPFDDEGVASRRNVLVDKGVLKGFFYDLKTAAQSGVEATGNGARSLFRPPRPSITNFVIETGESTLKEMVAGIDEGLLVEDVMGLGQGNVISGAFSNTLSLAYKIEKGEITGRVKDVSIAGNIYDLLPNVAAISQEKDWICLGPYYYHYNFSLPYILLDDMNVVTKE
jgi:PmbA protein